MDDDIHAVYEYTYDDGDNLLTKVSPWGDDFNDGTVSGWNGSSGSEWEASTSEAQTVIDGTSQLLWKVNTDADVDLQFTYTDYDTSSNARNLFVSARHTNSSDRVGVLIWPDRLLLRQYISGTGWTTLDSDLSADSVRN